MSGCVCIVRVYQHRSRPRGFANEPTRYPPRQFCNVSACTCPCAGVCPCQCPQASLDDAVLCLSHVRVLVHCRYGRRSCVKPVVHPWTTPVAPWQRLGLTDPSPTHTPPRPHHSKMEGWHRTRRLPRLCPRRHRCRHRLGRTRDRQAAGRIELARVLRHDTRRRGRRS